MNIFYLDKNPYVAASYHCDKHVVKMILESAQILSAAHFINGSWKDGMYKPTHLKHPSVIWTAQSTAHYMYVFELFQALCQEYTDRYGKEHKSSNLTVLLSEVPNCPNRSFIPPPQAMPDEYKHSDEVIAYRQYYKGAKMNIAQWKYSTRPYWM